MGLGWRRISVYEGVRNTRYCLDLTDEKTRSNTHTIKTINLTSKRTFIEKNDFHKKSGHKIQYFDHYFCARILETYHVKAAVEMDNLTRF